MKNGEFKLEKQYRLPEYDYSSAGAYFVTICTKNREEFFGEICNGIMGLNEIGCAVAKFYQEIPNHFKNVELNTWQIMPNHLHGVIEIVNNGNSGKNKFNRRNVINHVPTGCGFCINLGTNKHGIINNPMQMEQITLGRIIRWFKGRVTYEIHKNGYQNFAWQPRFHDRVIRSDYELNRICKYIMNNPQKWEDDRNNQENLWM